MNGCRFETRPFAVSGWWFEAQWAEKTMCREKDAGKEFLAVCKDGKCKKLGCLWFLQDLCLSPAQPSSGERKTQQGSLAGKQGIFKVVV